MKNETRNQFQNSLRISTLLAWLLVFCSSKKLDYVLLQKRPHDASCFTQGLVLHHDMLYESCGLYGESSIRKVDPKTGVILKQRTFPDNIFAEGITIIDKTIYLLTWKEKQLWSLELDSFEVLGIRPFQSYTNEGWGIAFDATSNVLVVSDGSSHLTTLEPPHPLDTNYSLPLKIARETVVIDPKDGKEIRHLNELEYVDGYILANIWYKDVVAKIDPQSGHVVRWFNLKPLYRRRSRTSDCLNGIAFDPENRSVIVTGKKWPHIYQLKLLEHNDEL